MWKEKITRLFNSNNITIEIVEKSKEVPCPSGCAKMSIYCTGGGEHKTTKTIEREVKKESPLGFYYTTKVRELIDVETGKKAIPRSWYTIVFNLNGVHYKMKFPIRVGDNVVLPNEDSLRPWEISENDHSLSDTMLKALQNQVSNFFDIMTNRKIKFVTRASRADKSYWEDGYWYWKDAPEQLPQIKNEVYGYLYGNKNGLRVQTDEQKILAHGFDLKTSFRKDKEEK